MRSMFGLYQLFCRHIGFNISYRKWLALGIAGLCFGSGTVANAITVAEVDGVLVITGTANADTIDLDHKLEGGTNHPRVNGTVYDTIDCADITKIDVYEIPVMIRSICRSLIVL